MSFCYCAEEFDEIISHCCIELKPGHRLQFYMNGLIETCDRDACEALDVGPADLAQALVAPLAPGGELAQVQGDPEEYRAHKLGGWSSLGAGGRTIP